MLQYSFFLQVANDLRVHLIPKLLLICLWAELHAMWENLLDQNYVKSNIEDERWHNMSY